MDKKYKIERSLILNEVKEGAAEDRVMVIDENNEVGSVPRSEFGDNSSLSLGLIDTTSGNDTTSPLLINGVKYGALINRGPYSPINIGYETGGAGDFEISIGAIAGNNSNGHYGINMGPRSGFNNTGYFNVFIGANAGIDNIYSEVVILGSKGTATASNQFVLGAGGASGQSRSIRFNKNVDSDLLFDFPFNSGRLATLDDISSVVTQDLQSVMNNGAHMVLGDTNSDYSSLHYAFQSLGGDSVPVMGMSQGHVQSESGTVTNSILSQKGGKLAIKEIINNGAGDKFSELVFGQPIADCTFSIPAKSEAGDYTLATSDDITLDKAVYNGNAIYNNNGFYVYKGADDNTDHVYYSANGIGTYNATYGKGLTFFFEEGSSTVKSFSLPSSKPDDNYILATIDDIPTGLTQSITIGANTFTFTNGVLTDFETVESSTGDQV